MKLLSEMVSEEHIEIVLDCLKKTKDIEGDVVELGCNVGTTSVYIQEFLKDKEFHVYDSFEGLPEKTKNDITNFSKGSCKTTKEIFINNFRGKKIPIIHEGWFKDAVYPDKISFAFLDGDFYSSIIDSLEKVYPRMSKGGIIAIHDYQWSRLPGVEKACIDFNPIEKIINKDNIGILTKL